MKRTCLFLTIAALVIGLSSIASAQPGQGAPSRHQGPPHMRPGPFDELGDMGEGDIHELIETVRMVRLSQELGLDDEKTVVLVRQYKESKDQISKHRRERQELAEQLKQAISSGQPEDTINSKLEQLMQHDRKGVELRFQVFEKAAQGLDPTQRAKLYVFMGEFDERLRGLVEQVRKRRMEGGKRMEGDWAEDDRRDHGDRPSRRGKPFRQGPGGDQEPGAAPFSPEPPLQGAEDAPPPQE